MKTLGNGIQQIINSKLYIVDVPCSECGGPMHAWKEPDEEAPRCPPVCMSCGHKSLKKSEAISNKQMFEDSLKSKAINYMKYGSIITDNPLWKCTLDNFRTEEQEEQQGKAAAEQAVRDILANVPVHAVFSGKTGVGKSHLSMGILQEVLEKSNYDKKCLFINYRELLEQLKFAMNDEQVRKQITGVVMKDIKLADVVVIDDLGAELGSVENPTRATNFDLDTITSIMEARQDKATVITTNLTGKMISELYSDRIVSRIMDNSHGYTMSFKTSKDKRMQPTF